MVTMVVAPLAGAWIEIGLTVMLILKVIVAPLAGAWIEIVYTTISVFVSCVAPLAGAWIEIQLPSYVDDVLESLPSRERGLKFYGIIEDKSDEESLPSRERGLK